MVTRARPEPNQLAAVQARPRRVLSKQQRLDEIVAAATDLFHEQGYEQTSVNQLADRLEMSIGGLYRYLSTKSDALVMVCENIYGDLPEQLARAAEANTEPHARAEAVIGQYLRACLDNRALILLMYREYRNLPEDAQTRYKELETSIANQIQAVVDDGIRSETFHAIDSALFALNVLLVGHQPALKGWQLPKALRSQGAYIKSQTALLMQTLTRQ